MQYRPRRQMKFDRQLDFTVSSTLGRTQIWRSRTIFHLLVSQEVWPSRLLGRGVLDTQYSFWYSQMLASISVKIGSRLPDSKYTFLYFQPDRNLNYALLFSMTMVFYLWTFRPEWNANLSMILGLLQMPSQWLYTIWLLRKQALLGGINVDTFSLFKKQILDGSTPMLLNNSACLVIFLEEQDPIKIPLLMSW